MTAEARYLVADGVLETHDHRHRYNHDGESHGHAYSGNTDGRAAHLVAVALVTIDFSGYE